jgi:pyruvate dehydrogenase E1 component alpha subunit
LNGRAGNKEEIAVNINNETNPGSGQLLAMYERMFLIRSMEQQLSSEFHSGNLPGAVHLYIGQEAVAVGVCEHLADDDKISSTHRGHGHFLAKGGDPKAMMAEVYGKKSGICQGMGGSMHVADFSKGIIGANGIVGAGFAITTGAGWAAKLDGENRVAVCFFGDGAANQGVFMESLNVCTLWNLPVIFVCEHNTFSEFSPSDTVTAGQISDRARAFGIPVEVVDGNDVVAVWQATGRAVEHARNGGGPSFIEAKTYRIHGHLEAEVHFLGGGPYRSEEEIEAWRQKCPISRLKNDLVSSETVSETEIGDIEARVQGQVEAALNFARESEPADENLVFELMFVGQQP